MEPFVVDVPSERDLVRRAREGSRDALEALVRHYYPRLRAYLSRLLGPDEGEDALQDVFIRMARGLSEYRERERFGGWLFRIAMNRARDLLRRRTGRGPALPEPANLPLLSADEDRERLSRAIARLPGELAEPLLLMYQEDWSQAAIAQSLGISVAAVKMRIYRAIRQLRSLLKEEAP